MKGIKILCTALAVICVICANLPAQGGFKTSVNLSKSHSMEPSILEDQWSAGFQLGVFFNLLKITPYVELRPEVMYIRKGSKLLHMGATDATYTIKDDYIEVPVLLKVNFLPNNSVNPYFIGGTYWAYLTRAMNDIDVAGIHNETVNIKDDLKTSDFGLIGGVGVEFKLGKMPKNILLEARYEFGMVDIYKGSDGRMKNSSIVFNVGFGF